MHIQLLADGVNKPKVVISHNSEKLLWDVNAFDKSNFSGNYDIFHYNNQYFDKQPENIKTAIFEIFKQIRIAFNEIHDWKTITSTIQPLLHSLFEYHDLAKVQSWILYDTDIQFPPDLKHEYIQSIDRNSSRSQTYIISDYQKLIALTFCLRLMIPIWGEFITKTKSDTGTSFKEYYAFLLLSKTQLFQSEAMDKLRTYVDCSIPDEIPSSTILSGISSEDFPLWILGLVVIRMLCTKDIRGHGPDSSLIPYIYNHVRERVRRCDTSFDSMVKAKIPGDSSDSEGRTSGLEGYKIRQEIPSGDVVLVEFAIKDIEAATKRICPDIDLDLLKNALFTSQVLLTKPIQRPQITLVQWVFKSIISTRGIDLLSKPVTVSALAATQAILWHKKHYLLASLVTATVSNSVDEDGISSIESRARITKDILAELQTYFPYTQKSPPRQQNAKPINLVVQAIDSVCDEFSSYNWVTTMDRYFLPWVTGSEANRGISIPHDIRIKMSQLVLDLAKNNPDIPNLTNRTNHV
jgi:hypothetical protein